MPLTPHVSNNDDKSDIFAYQVDSSGALSQRFDYRGRNRAASTPVGSIAVGAGAGTGATASIVTGSTDGVGTLQITCGTSTSAGTLAVLTFHDVFNAAPFVQLQPRDAVGAAANYYATTTTSALTIKSASAPTASSVLLVDYDLTSG